MTEYTYVDPADDEPVPVHVAFTEDETRRIYAIAEWYAAYCAQHGRAAPVDPMRALLEAAESMGARLEYISAAYEHAQWQAGRSQGSLMGTCQLDSMTACQHVLRHRPKGNVGVASGGQHANIF